MNDLASLGLVLLCALLAGHAVKFIRVPEVTGYIVVGTIVGPSMLGWVREDNVAALAVFSEVALALILFSIGTKFEVERFRAIGRHVVRLVFTDAILVGVVMTLMLKLLGLSWPAALLLGIISIETAAASTLMVLRECNAEGTVSELLVAFLALNNVVCLVAFSVLMGVLQISQDPSASGSMLQLSSRLVWQMFGSAALGYLAGVLLSVWADRATEHGEMLILIAGCMLLTVGAAVTLGLSPLVSSLTVGATAANLARRTQRLVSVLGSTDPPFYAIFFVVAGANLHLAELRTMGLVGVAYVVTRALAKLVAARFATRDIFLPAPVKHWFGASMLAHAGLAIGLLLAAHDRLPDLARSISTILLAAVLIYELIGPVLVRLVIVRSGEARPEAVAEEQMQLT